MNPNLNGGRRSTTRFKLHPDGVASLIAVILSDGDVRDLPLSPDGLKIARKRAIDFRRDQVLRLAREYYKVHPCNFDNTNDWGSKPEERMRNSMQNLAKLDRANLR